MNINGNAIFLAPMAGITDSVFRTLCKEQGADIVVSEMVSASGIFYGSPATTELASFHPSERPIGIQIFGADPDHLAYAASFIEKKFHPDFIDLNAGCPVTKVVKKNGGSSLLRDRHLFETIVRKVKDSISIPLTVKLRSGWKKYEWVDVEFAKIAESAGAAVVILHPRSQSMMFNGHSFWDRIAEVKKAVSIPVVGNGDIWTAEDAKQMFDETGCDAVMIGRGSYGNPWLFKQCKQLMQGETVTYPSFEDRKSMALRHLRAFCECYGEKRTAKEMKKHIAWYIRGIPGAARIRDSLFRTQTYGEIEHFVESIGSGVENQNQDCHG